MYKNQMTLQRITSILLLVAAVLVFVYSLGIMTDLYDSLYLVSQYDPVDDEMFYVPGSQIYLDMQEFNRQLTTAGILLILSAVALFVFKSNDRRRYYIANYVTIGVNAVLNIAVAVWMRAEVLKYKAQFLKMDFDRLHEVTVTLLRLKKEINTSCFWFDIVNVVSGVLFAVTAVSIFNLVFKIVLMYKERQLVKQGLEENHG